MTKNKIVVILSLVIILTAGTVAMGKSVVHFAVGAEAGTIDVYQEHADLFNALSTEHYVEVIPVPTQDYDQTIQTMIAGGADLDIFNTGDVMFPALVQKGVIANLQPYIERDSFDLEQFYPEVIDFFRWDGDVYAMTDNWDVQVLYYNADIFDNAGIPYPDETWDWDKLLAVAIELTTGFGRAKQWGLMFDPWFVPVFQTIWQNGGRVIAEDNSVCLIDQPEAVEALQWIADLFNVHEVSPSPQELSRMGMESSMVFTSGQVAMLLGNGRWMVPAFNESDISWAVAPVPKGKTGAVFFHLPAYGISSRAKNPDGAWEFLKFMLHEDSQRRMGPVGYGIPSHVSVATSHEFLDDPLVRKHNSVKPFIDSLEMTHKPPQVVNWWGVVDTLSELDYLWRNEMTAQEAADRVKVRVDRILAEEN